MGGAAIPIGAGIAGLFSYLGASKQAGATTDAANISAETAQQQLDYAKQIYEQQRQDLAPYRTLGAGFAQGLGYLSGIPMGAAPTTATPTTPTTPTPTTPTPPTFPDLVNAGNQQINMKNVMNQTLNRQQQAALQMGMKIPGLTQSQIDAMKNVGIDLTQPLNSRQINVLFGPTSIPPQWAQDKYNQQLSAQAAKNRQMLGVSSSMGPLTPAQLIDQSNPLNTPST